MAESKSPEANLRARDDIVDADSTTLVKDTSGALVVSAAAATAHDTKMAAEATAKEARAALPYMGNVTSGSVLRGKK